MLKIKRNSMNQRRMNKKKIILKKPMQTKRILLQPTKRRTTIGKKIPKTLPQLKRMTKKSLPMMTMESSFPTLMMCHSTELAQKVVKNQSNHSIQI